MPMCACVCHSLPLPGLSSLWVCCASCQDRLVRRGRVPNVTFESYIESGKLSVPGRDQQEQLRVQRAWRPHSLRRSEHEPKECAGSLLRRGRVPNVAFESNMQQGYRSVQRPLFAVGKRARPGKALKHLQGTVFSAEALSRPARPAFLLPFCCRRTPLVGSRCGQRSAGPPVRPLVFLSAAGALLWFLSFSSLLASAGSEAFVAGRSLWTASALKAMRSRYLSTLGLLSSGAVGVWVQSPACPCPCAPASVTAFGFAVRLAKTGWYAAAGCRTSLLNPI